MLADLRCLIEGSALGKTEWGFLFIYLSFLFFLLVAVVGVVGGWADPGGRGAPTRVRLGLRTLTPGDTPARPLLTDPRRAARSQLIPRPSPITTPA
jgi:hypothetical protein